MSLNSRYTDRTLHPCESWCQAVIEKAEKSDFAGVRRVLEMLESPYDPPAAEGEESEDYLRATPDWAADLVCTCSS